MLDHCNTITPRVAIEPQVIVDNTAVEGEIIDRKGYGSLLFVVAIGVLADPDATFAVSLVAGEAADLSDGTAAPSTDLRGTLALAGFTFADGGETRKVEYCGPHRYVRLVITPSGNDLEDPGVEPEFIVTPIAYAPVAAAAILGNPEVLPTPNPPE